MVADQNERLGRILDNNPPFGRLRRLNRLDGVWLRGNLHCHGGGPEKSESVRDWYRARGYDFLACTDHNVITPFQSDEGDGLVCIEGAELSDCHVVALGISEVPPREPASGEGIANLVKAVNDQGGLAVLAHPHWMGWPWEDLQAAAEAGIAGFEVSNALCYRSNGKGRADQLWELLLGAGYRPAAIGDDDAHSVESSNAGTVWTGVLAAERSAEAVLDAIRARRTYASEGPEIRSIRWEEPGVVVVECSPCVVCHFASERSGARSISAETPSGLSERFELDLATYGRRIRNRLRIDLEDDQGHHAWSSAMDVEVSVEDM